MPTPWPTGSISTAVTRSPSASLSQSGVKCRAKSEIGCAHARRTVLARFVPPVGSAFRFGTMDLNLATAHEAIAAAIPDRECIVFRDRRFTWARGHRPHAPAREHAARRAASAAVAERERARRPRVGPGPPRALPLQRQRVPRGHARRVTRRGVAPFNVNYRYVDGGAALPARRLAARRRSSTTPRSRRRSPRCAPTLPDARACCSRSPTSRGNDAAARRASTTRTRSPRASPTPPPVDAVARRPLHPLHRRHDRHAEGRAVAPGRHLRRGARRPRPRHRRGVRRPRRASSQRRTNGGAAHAARAAVHARRRATGSRFITLDRGRHRRHARRRPSASTPPTSGRPSSARRSSILLIVGDAFARPLLDELERRRLRPVARCIVLVSGGAPLSAAAEGASSSRMLPDADDRRRPRLVGDRRGRRTHVSAAGADATTGHVHARRRALRARQRGPHARARRRRRRDRLARAARPRAARLPRRRGQDRAHLPGRSTACATRCPATGPGCGADGDDRAARPRLGDDQLRRREDLRRGGRAGAQRPPRGVRRASWPAARASGGATRWSPSCSCATGSARHRRRARSTSARSTSPATSCRRRSSSSTRSCARPSGKADYRWARTTAST